jgi:hypothetical protein
MPDFTRRASSIPSPLAARPSQAVPRQPRLRTSQRLAGCIGIALALGLAEATPLEGLRAVITEEQLLQKAESESQTRIDALADQSDVMLSDYRFVLDQTEELRVYNQQLAEMVAAQESRLAGFEQRLAQAEATQRGVAPLLERMFEVLQRFHAADLPFLQEERAQRVSDLRRVLDDPAQAIGEKFRRVLEAYQVEMEYGRTIETWRGQVAHDGREAVADMLRIGRLALYFLTLDGRTGARWHASTGGWVPLSASDLPRLQRALRVARKEVPPELIALPVHAP